MANRRRINKHNLSKQQTNHENQPQIGTDQTAGNGQTVNA